MNPSESSMPPLRFDAFQKCFFRGEQRIAGLLPQLKLRFFPHYSYTRAVFNRQESDGTEYQQRKRSRLPSRGRQGFDMGIKLEKEVGACIDLLHAYPLAPMRCLWDPSFLLQSSLPASAKDKLSRMMKETRAFWKEMHRRRLRPIEAQVPVDVPGIATAVDVVCVDQMDRIVLIELKCGFKGYYFCCTDQRMKQPLHKRIDSLANQHQIQLAATRELYRATFPERTLGECMVLRVEGSKVHCYPLKKWAADIPSWAQLIRQ
jgi:hypothetical protein